MVYWQIGTQVVHFFMNGQDSPKDQDEKFQGRTSLFPDQMKYGNFSLNQLPLSFSLADGRCGSGGTARQMQKEFLFFLLRKMSETIKHVWVMPNH
uniref:Uncharacterized protein n=1 Tax=Ficedula albicollis TaxID=59894 RepID=A0A803V393_FICAL